MVSQAPGIATGPTRRHDEPVQPLHLPARVRPVGAAARVRPEAERASSTGRVRPGPGRAGRSQA